MNPNARHDIEHLLARDGAIARKRHPDLGHALEWQHERGHLRLVLPGVYVPRQTSREFHTLVCAVTQSDPNAILTGRAAARWSFWTEVKMADIDVAVRSKRADYGGFHFERRVIPPELIRFSDGAYFTAPALTALDLMADMDGDGVDTALRVGATNLAELHHALALAPNRRGNRLRAQILADSRDSPYARSERVLHRLLRSAKVTGWDTNVAVRLAEGPFYLDAAFKHAMLAIEIDGWEFHARHPADFTRTLGRHTALESAGWRVLHFTWEHLIERPEWVIAKIIEALAHC